MKFMLPVRDFRPTRIFPVITYTIIAANVLVFLLEIFLDYTGQLEWFFNEFAVTPYHIAQGEDLHTLISAMFMHGGYAHIFFNMLYLYIFGNNVEDSMGSGRFLSFTCCAGFWHLLPTYT